jgi:outer membrane lipoprotein-sorting protein
LLGANQSDWTVEKLMQQLSAISMVNLTFVERRKSEFLTEEMELNGSMVYRAPDYMEKNIESPFIENIVIEGDTISVEKIKKNGKIKKRSYSLTSHAALNTAVEGIRATMAGNFDLLSKNYSIDLQGECDQWKLILVPKNEKTLKYVAQIKFSGQEERINEIETTGSDGDISRLMFTYQLLQ